ncbi:hypothetical protein KEM48_013085 [Puccinia striiformis f. sp. tritici PST-130]|nr:hypothetical protein KEM48_013085 [Puccinia striiformis f. sp. tritici PST-130]
MAANLKYSGQANITAHVCQNKPEANIQMFRKSFIAWNNNSCKHLVAIIKFHPFATMEPSLKARYQHLAHHLIAQTAYQNPNNSNGQQTRERSIQKSITPLYDEVREQHHALDAPGLAPHFEQILTASLVIYPTPLEILLMNHTPIAMLHHSPLLHGSRSTRKLVT